MKNIGISNRIAICCVIIVAHFAFNTWLFSPGNKFDTGNVVHLTTAGLCIFHLFLFNKIINGTWFWWSKKD